MKENKNLSAFKGGRAARSNGTPITDNPYPRNTQLWKWWNGGWNVVDKRSEVRNG
jgi:hypothetical protein